MDYRNITENKKEVSEPPQAVILAAGQGTRMGKKTENKPKTLVEINGQPILDFILNRVAEVGISNVTIVVGYLGDKIIDHIRNNNFRLNINYIRNPIYQKTNSTYSLWLTRFSITNDIVVINADTLFNVEILTALIRENHDISMCVDQTKSGKLPPDNMKVKIVDGLLKGASKLLKPDESHGTAIGLYRFQRYGLKALYSKLTELVNKGIVDQLFTHAVQSIMHNIDVHPVSTFGLSWIEIDDVNDLALASDIVQNIVLEESEKS